MRGPSGIQSRRRVVEMPPWGDGRLRRPVVAASTRDRLLLLLSQTRRRTGGRLRLSSSEASTATTSSCDGYPPDGRSCDNSCGSHAAEVMKASMAQPSPITRVSTGNNPVHAGADVPPPSDQSPSKADTSTVLPKPHLNQNRLPLVRDAVASTSNEVSPEVNMPHGWDNWPTAAGQGKAQSSGGGDASVCDKRAAAGPRTSTDHAPGGSGISSRQMSTRANGREARGNGDGGRTEFAAGNGSTSYDDRLQTQPRNKRDGGTMPSVVKATSAAAEKEDAPSTVADAPRPTSAGDSAEGNAGVPPASSSFPTTAMAATRGAGGAPSGAAAVIAAATAASLTISGSGNGDHVPTGPGAGASGRAIKFSAASMTNGDSSGAAARGAGGGSLVALTAPSASLLPAPAIGEEGSLHDSEDDLGMAGVGGNDTASGLIGMGAVNGGSTDEPRRYDFDARPSPLVIATGSAGGGSGVGGGGAGAQQVSPSSIPPSPANIPPGAGGSFSFPSEAVSGGAEVGLSPALSGEARGAGGGTAGAGALPPLRRRKTWESGMAGGGGGGGGGPGGATSGGSASSTRMSSPEKGIAGRTNGRGMNKRFGPSSASSTASNSSPSITTRSAASTPDLKLPPELPPSAGKRSTPPAGSGDGRSIRLGSAPRSGSKAPLFPRPGGSGAASSCGSASSSEASTPAAAAGWVPLASRRTPRHRLTRSDSLGVFNRTRFLASWPSLVSSSSKSGPFGQGHNGPGVRANGCPIPMSSSGSNKGGGGFGSGFSATGGRGRKIKADFFDEEEEEEDHGLTLRAHSRERCCSDSAAVPIAPGNAAARDAALEAANVGRAGGGGGGGGRSRSTFARRFRSGKLLPSASAMWPASLRRAGIRGRGRSRSPPPDDAMVSPPPSLSLYGGDGVSVAATPSRGIFERRATLPGSLSRDSGSLSVWVSPLFRHRRSRSRTSPSSSSYPPPSPPGPECSAPGGASGLGGFGKSRSTGSLLAKVFQQEQEQQLQQALDTSGVSCGQGSSSPEAGMDPLDVEKSEQSLSNDGGVTGPGGLMPVPVPLQTPANSKRHQTEPPRPPGRPPHVFRRQGRCKRSGRAGGFSRQASASAAEGRGFDDEVDDGSERTTSFFSRGRNRSCVAGQDIPPSASWAGSGWASVSDVKCRQQQQQQQPRDQECQKQLVDQNGNEPRLAKEARQHELNAPQDKKNDPFVASSSSPPCSSSSATGCGGDQPAVHADAAAAATTIRAGAIPASSATTAEDVPVSVGSKEGNVDTGWDNNESDSGATIKMGDARRKRTNTGDEDANGAVTDSQTAAAPRQKPLGQTATMSGEASASGAAAAPLVPEQPPKELGSFEHAADSVAVAAAAAVRRSAHDEADMLAEAVLEEFTIAEETEVLPSTLSAREASPSSPPPTAANDGTAPRLRWEVFTFSQGVFQRVDACKGGTPCDDKGNPIAAPPGICLVDQAKELEKRRRYELTKRGNCAPVPVLDHNDITTTSATTTRPSAVDETSGASSSVGFAGSKLGARSRDPNNGNITAMSTASGSLRAIPSASPSSGGQQEAQGSLETVQGGTSKNAAAAKLSPASLATTTTTAAAAVRGEKNTQNRSIRVLVDEEEDSARSLCRPATTTVGTAKQDAENYRKILCDGASTNRSSSRGGTGELPDARESTNAVRLPTQGPAPMRKCTTVVAEDVSINIHPATAAAAADLVLASAPPVTAAVAEAVTEATLRGRDPTPLLKVARRPRGTFNGPSASKARGTVDDPCEVKVGGMGHAASVATAANGKPVGSTRVRKALAAADVVSGNNNNKHAINNDGLACVPEHAGGDASRGRMVEQREERKERSAKRQELSTSARPSTGNDDGTTTHNRDVKRVELAEEAPDGDVTIGGGDGSGNSGCYSSELMSHESSDQTVRVVEMNDGVPQTTLMASHDVKAMDRSLCGVQEGVEEGSSPGVSSESFHSAVSRSGSANSGSSSRGSLFGSVYSTMGGSSIGLHFPIPETETTDGTEATSAAGCGVCSARSLGGFRTAYRSRGGTSGDRPWRVGQRTDGGVGTNVGGGSMGTGAGDDAYYGRPGGSGYRPGNGEGLVVGRGVTVRADIRVPFGTVAITRGGELRGSVFAREFLLEEGGRLEGDVECDFAVIEGFLHASLASREVATVGPSARVYGDVIYNVLELDRGAVITGRLFSIRSSMLAGSGDARSGARAPDSVANARQRVEHELQQALRDRPQGIAEQGYPTEGSFTEAIAASTAASAAPMKQVATSTGAQIISTAKDCKESSWRSSKQKVVSLMSSAAAAIDNGFGVSDDHSTGVIANGSRSGSGNVSGNGSGHDNSSTTTTAFERQSGEGTSAAERSGEGDSEGATARAEPGGGRSALSGLWSTLVDGVAWARALSLDPANDSSSGATTSSTTLTTSSSSVRATETTSVGGGSRTSSPQPQLGDVDVASNAKMKELWLRAAERRARVSS